MSHTEKEQQFTIQKLKKFLFQEQYLIAENYKNISLKGDVKVTGQWSNPSKTTFGIFFDLSEDGESIRCSLWTEHKKEIENILQLDRKDCIVVGNVTVNKKYYNFELNVKQIKRNDEVSQLELLKKQCHEKGLLLHKKSVDWKSVSSIGIISKKNTQGYSDFMNQLQIPFHTHLEEIPLEGSQTAEEIIKKIHLFNSIDTPPNVIVIIRGGGNTTEIAHSYDKIELFEEIRKSNIPIVTAIGHHNDTNENLFITQISDLDYPTPTSLAKCVNSNVFDGISEKIGKHINILHQKFLEVMNDKQYKILFDLRKECEEWGQQFTNYHIVDLSSVPKEKEIIFYINRKYYKQTIDRSQEVHIHSNEIKKQELLHSFLHKNDIPALLKFVEKEEEPNKIILKLCKDWIKNEKDIKEFGQLKSVPVQWKELVISSKSIPKLQKQKQMFSYIQENILFHSVDLETFDHIKSL
jgi:exodeoxyribonuclease VII large subunit